MQNIPKDLQHYVISYLDAPSRFATCSVSKAWNELINQVKIGNNCIGFIESTLDSNWPPPNRMEFIGHLFEEITFDPRIAQKEDKYMHMKQVRTLQNLKSIALFNVDEHPDKLNDVFSNIVIARCIWNCQHSLEKMRFFESHVVPHYEWFQGCVFPKLKFLQLNDNLMTMEYKDWFLNDFLKMFPQLDNLMINISRTAGIEVSADEFGNTYLDGDTTGEEFVLAVENAKQYVHTILPGVEFEIHWFLTDNVSPSPGSALAANERWVSPGDTF